MSEPSLPDSTTPASAATVLASLTRAVGRAEAVTLAFDSPTGRLARCATLLSVTNAHVRFALGAAHARLLADASAREGGAAVIASLRVEGKEIVFFTKLADLGPAGTDAAVDVEVALALPSELVATKRRRNFRIAVTSEDGLQIRVWRIDEHTILRDQPKPSRSFRAELYDLSATGMRAILWARPVEAMQLCVNQRFRIEIKVDEVEMIFDARLRHPRASGRDDDRAFCGFELVDRDDIEGRRNRQRLDTLLAKLQRAAMHRQSAAA